MCEQGSEIHSNKPGKNNVISFKIKVQKKKNNVSISNAVYFIWLTSLIPFPITCRGFLCVKNPCLAIFQVA